MMILSLNTLLMSMPSFFLGLVLIIVFGVQLKLIPVIGLNPAPEQHFAGLIGPGDYGRPRFRSFYCQDYENSHAPDSRQ